MCATTAAPLVPCAGALDPGTRLSDEGLRARLGVPLRGRIRVSHENRCMAIVDRMDGGDGGPGTAAAGGLARYMGEDSGGDGGGADRALEGGNLDLALSRVRGYEVLGFARDGDDLVFDGPVECDSFRFEGRGGRSVLTFGMRAAAAGGGEKDDCDEPGPEAEKNAPGHRGGDVCRQEACDRLVRRVHKKGHGMMPPWKRGGGRTGRQRLQKARGHWRRKAVLRPCGAPSRRHPAAQTRVDPTRTEPAAWLKCEHAR